MSSELLHVLGLEGTEMRGHFIGIQEESDVDASFILHHLIAESCRHSKPVHIILFHQTLGHYNNISQRLGYNLQHLIKSGQVTVYEGLVSMAKNIQNGGSFKTETFMKILFEDVRSKLKENSCLFIDDLTILLTHSIPVSDIVYFYTSLHTLLQDLNGSLVISGHIYNRHDTESYLMTYLSRSVDVLATVYPIKTGRSKEVSGNLVVRKSTFGDSRQLQYRLEDKGIKIFELGAAI